MLQVTAAACPHSGHLPQSSESLSVNVSYVPLKSTVKPKRVFDLSRTLCTAGVSKRKVPLAASGYSTLRLGLVERCKRTLGHSPNLDPIASDDSMILVDF